MIWARHIPAVLSSLLLAAHFFRAGGMIPALVCLGLPLMLLLPGPRTAGLFQGYLLFGVVTWIWTAFEIGGRRLADGEPWIRMAVILGGVALFTLYAAALFETPAMRRRYGGDAPRAEDAE